MKSPLFETVPSWFKLGWRPERHALQIHIAETFISSQKPIPTDAPVVRGMRKSFPDTLFTEFCGDLSQQYFGFGRSIKRLDHLHQMYKDFVSFEVPLPRIWVETGMVCHDCEGTTERNGMDCISCRGTGKDVSYDWHSAFEVTTNLWLLFLYLDADSEQGASADTIPQWFTLTLCAERESHGSSLGGSLSRDGLQMLNILVSHEERREEVEHCISTALTAAWEWMMGGREYDLHDLRAEICATPNLFLSIPGDAAGVYTENQSPDPERGCKIGCHNMDNPAQALSTLVGLAVFGEILENAWREQQKIMVLI
jgi:hypothetical protein